MDFFAGSPMDFLPGSSTGYSPSDGRSGRSAASGSPPTVATAGSSSSESSSPSQVSRPAIFRRLTSASPVVVRAYQQHGPAQFETAGETAAPVASQSLDSEQVCSSQRNRVYANDVIKLCTPSPVTGVGE